MLKPSAPVQEEEEDPLAYYENHTSQIEVGTNSGRSTVRGEGMSLALEASARVRPCACMRQIVRQDRSMEQIVFPVPGICQFLTEETKHRLFTTTEQDEQGSKVSDFFDQSSFLHNEMEWQRKLRSEDPAGREGPPRSPGPPSPAGGCPTLTPRRAPVFSSEGGLALGWAVGARWGSRWCWSGTP